MSPDFFKKTKYHKSKTANSGFTMVELLTVVAILLLVGLIAVLSLTKLRRDLRQRELDAKAEIIYVAAQNRMAELRAAGCEGLYSKGLADGDNGVYRMDFDSSHMDESSRDVEFLYLYVNDTSSKLTGAPAALLPDTAVDRDLWSHCWCIEYAPETGSIYAVFYSESALPSHTDLNGSYRNFNYRARTATVGYYGGDIAQNQDISKFNPSISIENAEKLTATFYCNNPSDDTASYPLTFTITVSDGLGGSYTRTITGTQGGLQQLDSRNYKFQWVLDDLTTSSRRFFEQTHHQVSCGTPLTLTLTVSSQDPTIDTVFTSRMTNGLFADRTDLGFGADTALIAYGRHLANLSETSHVSSTITSAVQIGDISFADDPADKNDWYSIYTAAGKKFEPITNKNLNSYTGSLTTDGATSRYIINSLTVTASPAALFSNFSGKITNCTLVNASVSGGIAGALVGQADGDLTLDGCRVYLTEVGGLKTGSIENVPARISGTQVGGLVGNAAGRLTIQNSFASTTIKGNSVAGGLVGHMQQSASIDRSYADCYITAPVTGGLVGTTGSSGLTVVDSYAAGYQLATNEAAGFVAGKLQRASRSYSACAYPNDPTVIYTIAKEGTATSIDNAFYLTSGLDGKNYTFFTETSNGRSYAQMSAAAFLTELGSSAFTAASADTTQPYNLLSQGLSTYSYPRLSGLSHYGDWQAEFETEALVYYERYADGSVGFFGGNVDNLSEEKVIYGDGYAVALSAPLIGDQKVTVAYGANVTELTVGSTRYYTNLNGADFYLYPVTMLTTSTSNDTNFYQNVVVNERVYQFNPYFAKTVTSGSGAGSVPGTIFLRTARHLYELSLHYDDYDIATTRSTFRQERDISYNFYQWRSYTNYLDVRQQAPIASTASDGGDTGGFRANYNGGGHTISGVSFVTDSNDVGMFAVIAPAGTVQNVAVLSDGGDAVTRQGLINGSTTVVYMGVLAGRNYGTITNCAVSGYDVGLAEGILAYQNSTVYAGGLVGGNLYHRDHSGYITASEANCPMVLVSAYSSQIYVGGFTGSNAGGSIQSCYALGVLKARDVSSSTVRLSGFAGENASGSLAYCYSATALTASGEAEIYGLTKVGGSAVQCYYLDGGTYAYDRSLYAYNASRSSFSVNAAQAPITGANLEKQSLYGFTRATAGADSAYPYPAVVRNASGSTVHYGAWPVQQDIGTMGVFYWEQEEGGNAGYHLSYIGTDDGGVFSGSTLCVQHNDSGAVKQYGYGIFYINSSGSSIRLDTSDDCHLGVRNSTAEQQLKAQMPEYDFVAYTTGDGRNAGSLYLTGANTNSTWTLTLTTGSGTGASSISNTYTVCPFFADAISLDTIGGSVNTNAETNVKPGTKAHPYQVRSVSQLQNINWNYGTLTADHAILATSYDNGNTDANITKYPYLGSYRYSVGWGESKFGNQTRRYWQQTHDVDAAKEYADPDHLFTPIGNMVDKNNSGEKSSPYVAYFCSDYDGGAYTVRNIQIRTTAQCVGLFGFTIGANLKDIVMYSDRSCEIVNDEGGTGWYAVGGLVGYAGAGVDNASFTNCSVSGYTIRNIRKYEAGWGGGCVGGLVGSTNMDITGCTAVTDIITKIGYNNAWNNLRIGGIAGVCRATLDKCYAGGKISAEKLDTNHNGYGSSTSLWVAGLVGGVITRDLGDLETSMGTTTRALVVQNCYSFVELPPRNNNSTNRNHVMSSFAIASNGEMRNQFDTTTNKRTIPNTSIRIINSYALIDTIQNTEDYQNFSRYISNWAAYNQNVTMYQEDENRNSTLVTVNGVNLNTVSTSDNDWNNYQRRRIMLSNERSPYITYEQMKTELKDWLNVGASASTLAFSTVTVEENGAPIPGKYSFPGAGMDMLDGLDFPFPTILTQRDVSGRTVNVHYGRWPMSGLYWERTRTTLDLCADRTGAGAPTLTVKLHLKPDSAITGQAPVISLVNDTDGAVSTLLDFTEAVYNSAERCWEVTFTGKGRTGLAVARATLDDHTAEMTIDVTQTLLLTSDRASTGVDVKYGGESQAVQLTLTDAKNNPIVLKPGETLTWAVAATKQGGGYDSGDESIVECGAVTAVDAAKGIYTFDVSGFSSGVSTVTVSCTYSYPEDGEIKTVTARLLLAARSTRDAVGLVYDVAEDAAVYSIASGVYRRELNDVSQPGTADVTVPEFPREAGRLYLFAGSGYTDLSEFSIAAGALSVTDSEGSEVSGVDVRLGDAILTAEGVQYREVTFTADSEVSITGDILVQRGGVTYTLHLENYVYKPETAGTETET